MRAAAFAYVVLLLQPAAVQAERALLLAPHVERGASDSELATLRLALGAALTGAGLQAVDGAELQDAVPDPCPDPACLASQLTTAGADHAVELKAFREPQGSISGVTVSVLTAAGDRYGEGAEVTSPDDLEAAVTRAAAGAYVRFRRGPGPWLDLQGAPVGAAIAVDGQASGALPRRVRVKGGLHRVAVSHPGYAPFEETVTVPRNLDAFEQLTVSLEPLVLDPAYTEYTSPEPPPPSSASPWNYVIGGALAVTGVLLAVGPLQSALDDGECGRRQDGRCTGIVRFNATEGLKLAAGGVLLAGGAAFAVLAPLRVEHELGPLSGARREPTF